MLFQHIPTIWGSTILSQRPYYVMLQNWNSNSWYQDWLWLIAPKLLNTTRSPHGVSNAFWSPVNVYKLLALQHADLKLKQCWEHPLPRIDPAVLCVYWIWLPKEGAIEINRQTSKKCPTGSFPGFFWLCDLNRDSFPWACSSCSV